VNIYVVIYRYANIYKHRAPLQLARDRNADAKCELSAKISRGILSKRNTILRRGRLLELLLPAIRAAAIISTPSATLISKTRSCDHLKALGHSYQQDPKLRLSQRFGPLLSASCSLLVACWLLVVCRLLFVACCVLIVVCLVFVVCSLLCLYER